MKVIKKGREQKGWTKKFTCTGKGNGGGGCGAVLLVSKDDFYRTSSHYYDGGSDYYDTFMCPCCKVETDAESLPFYVTQSKSEYLKKAETEEIY